jgi:hypothetical protein
MPLVVDTTKTIEENIKANALPVGGRRRKYRGGDGAEEVGRATAAKIAIIGLLKKASEIGYDTAVKGAQAAGYAGVAGTVLYIVDQTLRPNLCDPLTLSLAKALSMIPSIAGYTATCESAAAAYTTAIVGSALALSPLVVKALKKVASIVVSDETVDTVADAIVQAVRNPSAVASAAVGQVPPPLPPRRGGRRKTSKRKSKRRATRRQNVFAY